VALGKKGILRIAINPLRPAPSIDDAPGISVSACLSAASSDTQDQAGRGRFLLFRFLSRERK
jgi:hypothetical protein